MNQWHSTLISLMTDLIFKILMTSHFLGVFFFVFSHIYLNESLILRKNRNCIYIHFYMNILYSLKWLRYLEICCIYHSLIFFSDRLMIINSTIKVDKWDVRSSKFNPTYKILSINWVKLTRTYVIYIKQFDDFFIRWQCKFIIHHPIKPNYYYFLCKSTINLLCTFFLKL
jgi:hypothetical protein